MARFKENTNWLQDCDAFRDIPHYVYQKELFPGYSPVRTNATAIHPNIGYECPAYMQFILDHYDHLPDVMFFLHGYPFEHCARLQHVVHSDELYRHDLYMFSWLNLWLWPSGFPGFWPHQVLLVMGRCRYCNGELCPPGWDCT